MSSSSSSGLRGYLQRHDFLTSVLKVISGTGVAQLVAMVAMFVVTHKVSPDEWGTYTAVYSAAAFVIPVASLRYDMAIVLPRDDGEAKAIFWLATKINAIISTVATLVMIPLGGVLARLLDAPAGTRWWMLAVGLFIFTYCEYSIVNFWANRRKQFGVIGTNAVWNQSITAAGRLAAAFTGLGAGGQVVAAIVGEVAGLWNFRTRLGKDLTAIQATPIRTRVLMRKYRKMPLLTAPNVVVDSLRQQGIVWVLGLTYSRATMGLFGLAWSLMQVPASVINQAMSQVFFQRLSVTDAGHMFRIVRKTAVRSALVGIVPFALLYVLVPPVLPMLLGAKYAAVASISVALVPWLYMNFITSPVSNLFIVTRNNGLALVFAVVYAAVPLVFLATHRLPVVSQVSVMAWLQSGLLVIYIGLALLVAWNFDRRAGAGAADAPAGEGGSAEEGGPGEA